MLKYQQASPCGGVVFYKKMTPDKYQIYLSERRNAEGSPIGKFSIYGGFVECGDLAKNSIGTIQNKFVEIYRECVEEIGSNFSEMVTEAEFVDQAEFVCSQLVRTNDGNVIHDALLLAFEVTPELERFFACEVKSTVEQMPAKAYDISLKFDICSKPLLPPYDGHELLGFLDFPNLHMQYQHEKTGIALFLRNKFYES
jgi:hypothetical protein